MGIQQDGQDATYPLKKLEEFIRKKLSEIWQGVLDGLRGDRRAQRSLFGMVAGGLAYLLSKKTIGKITENVRENSAAKEASRKALRDLKRQDKAMTTRKYRRERGYTFFATARLNHMKNFPEGLVPIMTKKLKDQKIVNVVLTKNGKYDVVGPSGVHLNRQLNEMYRMAVREKVQESILSGYNKYKNDLDKFVKSSQFRDMKTFNKDEGLNEQKDNFLKDYSAKKIACDKFSRHIYPSQHTMALSDFLKNKEEIKKLGDIKINYDPRDGVIQINSKLEDALKVDNFCNSKHIPRSEEAHV